MRGARLIILRYLEHVRFKSSKSSQSPLVKESYIFSLMKAAGEMVQGAIYKINPVAGEDDSDYVEQQEQDISQESPSKNKDKILTEMKGKSTSELRWNGM